MRGSARVGVVAHVMRVSGELMRVRVRDLHPLIVSLTIGSPSASRATNETVKPARPGSYAPTGTSLNVYTSAAGGGSGDGGGGGSGGAGGEGSGLHGGLTGDGGRLGGGGNDGGGSEGGGEGGRVGHGGGGDVGGGDGACTFRVSCTGAVTDSTATPRAFDISTTEVACIWLATAAAEAADVRMICASTLTLADTTRSRMEAALTLRSDARAPRNASSLKVSTVPDTVRLKLTTCSVSPPGTFGG